MILPLAHVLGLLAPHSSAPIVTTAPNSGATAFAFTPRLQRAPLRPTPPPSAIFPAAVLADATPFERNDDVSLGALLGVLAPFIFAAAVFGGFYRLFKLFSSEF